MPSGSDLNQPASFQDYLRSASGRAQLARWMGGTAAAFVIAFGLMAWYAEAEVPLLFWPIIAGGGGLLGLHLCHLRWQARAEKSGQH
jgi:hypothetical protein